MSFQRLARIANRQVVRTMRDEVTLPGATVVWGVFGNGSEAMDVGAPLLDVIAPVPWVLLREEDASVVEVGDTLTIYSVDYTVREILPDSFGMIRFNLRLADD